jgi:hypothetical protein
VTARAKVLVEPTSAALMLVAKRSIIGLIFSRCAAGPNFGASGMVAVGQLPSVSILSQCSGSLVLVSSATITYFQIHKIHRNSR